MIENLAPAEQATIEALQPYKRGRGGKDDALSLLTRLNDADKHRVVQVVAGYVAHVSYGGFTEQDDAIVQAPFPRFESGAEVVRAAPHVVVNPKLGFLIMFSEGCPDVKDRGVHYLLDVVCKHVSGIIEDFALEFGGS